MRQKPRNKATLSLTTGIAFPIEDELFINDYNYMKECWSNKKEFNCLKDNKL